MELMNQGSITPAGPPLSWYNLFFFVCILKADCIFTIIVNINENSFYAISFNTLFFGYHYSIILFFEVNNIKILL